MTTTPSVSVLMAVYNGERFLEAAIRSVLVQSYRDFEVIVWDDGSKDGSRDIIARLAKEDARIRAFTHPDHGNRGIPLTSNAMIAEARGQFLSIMDHDDEMEPTCLAEEIAHLKAHPECVAVGVQDIYIDGSGKVIRRRRKLSSALTPFNRRVTRFKGLSIKVPFIGNPASMIRAEAMRRVGGYRPEFPFASDNDVWFRLSDLGELHQLNKVLLRYRRHGANATMQKKQTILLYDAIAHLSALARRFRLDDRDIIAGMRIPQGFQAAADRYRSLIGDRYPVETFVHSRAVRYQLPLAVGARDYGEVLRLARSHALSWPPSMSKLQLLRKTVMRSGSRALQSKATA